MPYTVPTLAQFRTRFPAFAAKSDALIEMMLVEAAGRVDATWREADYQPAIMYLAAHLIATDASQTGEDIDDGSGTGDGDIDAESFSGMSISYKSASKTSAVSRLESDYDSTIYGRRFYHLLRVNFPPIVAI